MKYDDFPYDDFDDLVENEIIPTVTDINKKGRAEYANDIKNVFANFDRVASLVGISPKQVALVYFLKHTDGICSYVEHNKPQRDSIRGRITDAIVYLMLLWGMFERDNLNDGGK